MLARFCVFPVAAILALWAAPIAQAVPAISRAPKPAPLPPPAIVLETPPAEPAYEPMGPPAPPRKVLLPNARVTPAISRVARELLDRKMGSETVRSVGDRTYAFVVERHYHSPQSGLTPVGWHKGVTVYAIEP